MKDDPIELADVVRRFGDAYVAEYGHRMMPSQRRALADIAACMTAEMGGHQYRCLDCDKRFWVYHGCRNRACPACHGPRMRQWLQARQAELLPCDYYHVVATVPEMLRPPFFADQKFMYGLFMRTVAGALMDLANDPRHLGAMPGILMVLHTWTGQLHGHPHVHLLVTGGGVTADGQSWCEPSGQFLVPVKALSKLIAARFRDALKKAKPAVFARLPPTTWRQAWCSFCKPYGRGKKAVLDYLARYAFRIAITNARLVRMDETHVTFKYKDRDTRAWKLRRLTGVEFLRRFLIHVLPKGFHKLRYYGLWHYSKRDLQQRACLLLKLRTPVPQVGSLRIATLTAVTDRSSTDALTAGDGTRDEGFSPTCPVCGSRRVRLLQERCRGPGPVGRVA